MNGIRPCKACGGNGFVYRTCGCREAACPHESMFGDGTYPELGIYHKFWVRRTDGSSEEGQKHENCDYFVLDWKHDKFAAVAALAYAAACEAEYPELAIDLRARAREAMRAHDATPPSVGGKMPTETPFRLECGQCGRLYTQGLDDAFCPHEAQFPPEPPTRGEGG